MTQVFVFLYGVRRMVGHGKVPGLFQIIVSAPELTLPRDLRISTQLVQSMKCEMYKKYISIGSLAWLVTVGNARKPHQKKSKIRFPRVQCSQSFKDWIFALQSYWIFPRLRTVEMLKYKGKNIRKLSCKFNLNIAKAKLKFTLRWLPKPKIRRLMCYTNTKWYVKREEKERKVQVWVCPLNDAWYYENADFVQRGYLKSQSPNAQ